MGTSKAELKILIAHDIGSSLEDRLEAAQRAEYQYEGGQVALKKAQQNLLGVASILKKDLEEGNLDPKKLELTDGQRVHDLVKKWLGRCFVSLEGTAEKERAGQIGMAGMVSGIKKCMEVPLKIMEVERAKMEAAKVVAANGDAGPVGANGKPRPRVAGTRPGDPMADVRKRDAKSKKAKAPKARRCSVCKKTGHTSRSCPKVLR